MAPETLFEFIGSHTGFGPSGTVLALASGPVEASGGNAAIGPDRERSRTTERTSPAAILRPPVRRAAVSHRVERLDIGRVTDAR
ncbi:hypothetical protein GCM10008994_03610 [Halorubrum ejinorense]|uniref:Uncharacterized protein n=1 Tax=Halorubrum ejinorense TaxID=425309 RepID=A0AAV3SNH1_9EURY